MEVIGLGLIIYFGIIIVRFVLIPIRNAIMPPPTEEQWKEISRYPYPDKYRNYYES